VQLALHTGARKSNLMHLRWEQIDSNARTVRFTKTKNNRTVMIPLDDTVLSVLKTLREQTADSEWVFPELQSGRSFRTAWRTCLKRAGITGWRWHDLRHAFASSLSQNGVDINSVRQLLGHADLRSTVRYAALSPDFLAAQIRVLDKALPKNCQSPAPKRRKSRQTAATRKSLRKAATA
jgi:integrase